MQDSGKSIYVNTGLMTRIRQFFLKKDDEESMIISSFKKYSNSCSYFDILNVNKTGEISGDIVYNCAFFCYYYLG